MQHIQQWSVRIFDPEHQSSPPVFSVVRVTFSAIVLSVLLRYTDSDYHFGIFKLFLVYMTRLKTRKG